MSLKDSDSMQGKNLLRDALIPLLGVAQSRGLLKALEVSVHSILGMDGACLSTSPLLKFWWTPVWNPIGRRNVI